MEKITDLSQSKRLKEFGINIKTKYQTEEGIRERNTDQSLNQNVKKGVRIEKSYYRNGTILHKSKNFDSRILYSYISDENNSDYFVCPNCGAISEKDKVDGSCPYCGNFLNLDYDHKDLGTKYTYDQTLKNRNYVLFTFLIDLIVSIILSWIYIAVTGRTFNIYDFAKVVAFGVTVAAALFYLFYYLDALIILGPVKKYKDKMNQKQICFWEKMEEKGIPKEKFYNNLNYELSRYYFENNDDIIDFDLIDTNDIEEFYEDGKLMVRINLAICTVKYLKPRNKIRSKTQNQEFILEYQGAFHTKMIGGVNQIRCKNCGSSMDVTAKKCPYCSAEYHSVQEWIIR